MILLVLYGVRYSCQNIQHNRGVVLFRPAVDERPGEIAHRQFRARSEFVLTRGWLHLLRVPVVHARPGAIMLAVAALATQRRRLDPSGDTAVEGIGDERNDVLFGPVEFAYRF